MFFPVGMLITSAAFGVPVSRDGISLDNPIFFRAWRPQQRRIDRCGGG